MSFVFDYHYHVGVLLERLDSGDVLSEEDIKNMVCTMETVKEAIVEQNQWPNEVTVVKLQDRYFAVEWSSYLSETGDSAYPNQPYEVEELEEKHFVRRPKNR